jgi:hypothetical protein
VFVTINVPGGSNNDADVWYKGSSTTPTQADERTNRTAADIRWLDAAFALAHDEHAKGVVIAAQADMWDLDGKTTAHLTNYEPIISEIAVKTATFGRPVLLFNGDSHLYRSDNPLSPTAPCTGETDPATGTTVCAHDANNNAWSEHPYYNVTNFHRVVVHGSTTPLEWLKLTIGSNAIQDHRHDVRTVQLTAHAAAPTVNKYLFGPDHGRAFGVARATDGCHHAASPPIRGRTNASIRAARIPGRRDPRPAGEHLARSARQRHPV